MKTLQKTNKKVGRPTKITAEIITKLESVFKLGVIDKVALNYAELAERTYYDNFERNLEFRSKMLAAQHFGRLAAGNVIMDAIVKNRDVDAAKWWLERKYKDEFGTQGMTINQQFNVDEMKIEFE